jgi:hypothetical protein
MPHARLPRPHHRQRHRHQQRNREHPPSETAYNGAAERHEPDSPDGSHKHRAPRSLSGEPDVPTAMSIPSRGGPGTNEHASHQAAPGHYISRGHATVFGVDWRPGVRRRGGWRGAAARPFRARGRRRRRRLQLGKRDLGGGQVGVAEQAAQFLERFGARVGAEVAQGEGVAQGHGGGGDRRAPRRERRGWRRRRRCAPSRPTAAFLQHVRPDPARTSPELPPRSVVWPTLPPSRPALSTPLACSLGWATSQTVWASPAPYTKAIGMRRLTRATSLTLHSRDIEPRGGEATFVASGAARAAPNHPRAARASHRTFAGARS